MDWEDQKAIANSKYTETLQNKPSSRCGAERASRGQMKGSSCQHWGLWWWGTEVVKNGQTQNMVGAYCVTVIRSICQLASMSPPVRSLMGCHSNPLWRWGWLCDSSRPFLDRRIQKPLCQLPLYGQRLYGQQAFCHFFFSLPWWRWRLQQPHLSSRGLIKPIDKLQITMARDLHSC